MSQPTMTLALSCDTAQASADLSLLEGASRCSQRVRQALFDLGDLGSQIRLVQLDVGVAASANHMAYSLELASGLANVLAAIRAGEFDDQV